MLSGDDDGVDHMLSGNNGVDDDVLWGNNNDVNAIDMDSEDHSPGPLPDLIIARRSRPVSHGSSTSVKPTAKPPSSSRSHIQGSTSGPMKMMKRGRSDSTTQSGKK